MAAILPSGMRAVSTEISPETGAGGFILPNDRVDVILTHDVSGSSNVQKIWRSDTILQDVRLLAIDQTAGTIVIGQMRVNATRPLKPVNSNVW